MGEVSGKRYARESLVAGLLVKKIVALICFQGTMDCVIFNFWLENFLLDELGPRYTILMDNAALHKSQQTKDIIEEAGCGLLFLPPYSPDLNPIDKFWANLKARIKSCISKFSSLSDVVDYSLKTDHFQMTICFF